MWIEIKKKKKDYGLQDEAYKIMLSGEIIDK